MTNRRKDNSRCIIYFLGGYHHQENKIKNQIAKNEDFFLKPQAGKESNNVYDIWNNWRYDQQV